MPGISSCKAAAELTPATRRRLLGDLKRLQEEPIPLAAAAPCDDSDVTLWNGVIGVNMEVTHFGAVTVPLHFLIDFPWNYPQSAPNIGFSFEFRYRGGAEYVMPDGRLKGKKVICLDVLGNFGGVHTEWKQSVGSGWTPAYTVTTLLVQLQSVLCDLGVQMSQQERDVTYQSAMRFAEKHPSAMLELLDEEELRDRREQRVEEARLLKVCGSDEALAAKARAFAAKARFVADSARMADFLDLLAEVAARSAGSTTAGSSGSSPLGSSKQASPREPAVDSNICCFSTGKLYTEALLGVGLSRAKNNLATAGELLSKEAFDGGLRQNTNKSPFEFFLPVWINAAHAGHSEAWCAALRESYLKIGSSMYRTTDEDGAILEVFPRLINQLIVEMMKPDAQKSEAIATFEAMCNFWRTLRWLVDSRASLRKRIRHQLTGFISQEAQRHKDASPDLGMVLVLFTVYQGLEGCPERRAFVDAYADENSLRWVMWWQRAGAKAESGPVFEATKVSRDIAMFQLMVVDVVIGEVPETLLAMEASNCKLPERLEKLQVQWRERKASTNSWATYFEHLGTSAPEAGSLDDWIARCVRRAAALGPKYGGAKGEGKGGCKGKSEGKGGATGSGGGKGKGKGGARGDRW